MSYKKVLILPGDGCGPAVIQAAERVINAAAPMVDLIHGEIGRSAYEHTADVLPVETEDMIADCDSILCGHVDVSEMNVRDPVLSILRHTNMYAEMSEFYPLSKSVGNRNMDIAIIGPNTRVNQMVSEMESLEGVDADYFTSSDDTEKFFEKSVTLCEAKKKSKVALVTDSELLPTTIEMYRNIFQKVFAATEFQTSMMQSTDATCLLAEHPGEVEILIAGPFSGPFLRGEASGMNGGRGLMARAFIGEDMAMYMPDTCPMRTDNRIENPTSAILASALLLLNLGFEQAHDNIVMAVREMYRLGKITPDVGGKKTPKDFTDGVIEFINSH